MTIKNVLISLKPTYIRKILSGEKTVELRRRKVGIEPGTILWMYSTLPEGAIKAAAVVDKIDHGCPSKIWAQHSTGAGISKHQYTDYVKGCSCVSAISLANVRPLREPISLEKLRDIVKKFHPPQFIHHLEAPNPILTLLNSETEII